MNVLKNALKSAASPKAPADVEDAWECSGHSRCSAGEAQCCCPPTRARRHAGMFLPTTRAAARAAAARYRSTRAADTIAGTVATHQAYILLHGKQSPQTFPPRVVSPLQQALQRHGRAWGALVNFAWTPGGENGERSGAQDQGDAEVYNATVFAAGRAPLDLRAVTLSNLEDVYQTIDTHLSTPLTAENGIQGDSPVRMYVCTHGARDCRCGEWGPKVANALRDEAQRRQENGPHITVGEVGHVGGHKYAANVLIFPRGDWLGTMRPEDAPTVIDSIIARTGPYAFASDAPLCIDHWRGRMGLTKEEQLELYNSHKA